jgi:glycosyltransferase involved in cell wall biosynthesis
LNNHLHIIALDVPWPPDYGGVIDLFYKIKSLHRLGVKIHLHCFCYSRKPQQELNQYCETVIYYDRKNGLNGFSLQLPFIVKSRAHATLITNLNKDSYPVLLEGIHCSYYLNNGGLSNRKILVRLHNVEFEYYKKLKKNERNILKKIYFAYESKLLYKYEKSISNKAVFLAMSQKDRSTYKKLFNAENIHFLPVFTPYSMATGKEGKGFYCLYHGNLSVNENEAAAIWLLQQVFNDLQIPFVIAGKNPSKKLEALAHKHQHTCLVANPGEKEMQDMIAKAQLHVLPSFNNTGIKLKLLNALFNGRHCLVNTPGVDGSGLENACHIASDAASFKQKIMELYQIPFTEQEKEERQVLLQAMYNNEVNATKLLTFL